jgi:hypothetical protein
MSYFLRVCSLGRQPPFRVTALSIDEEFLRGLSNAISWTQTVIRTGPDRRLSGLSLANVRCLSYPPTRHNHETMLMTINTRMFLPEAAEAASALPRWHRPVDDGSQTGYVLTLAERWMR